MTDPALHSNAEFVENLFAPEYYASEAAYFWAAPGVLTITFTSFRLDHSPDGAGRQKNGVVARLVMPISGAQGLATGLYDFLAKNGGMATARPAEPAPRAEPASGPDEAIEPAAAALPPAPASTPPKSETAENLFAPEVFASEASFFTMAPETVSLTFSSYRFDQSPEGAGTRKRVIVARIVLPIGGAQGLATGLYEFLVKLGLDPVSRPVEKEQWN
jgi:hypothetical protein